MRGRSRKKMAIGASFAAVIADVGFRPDADAEGGDASDAGDARDGD